MEHAGSLVALAVCDAPWKPAVAGRCRLGVNGTLNYAGFHSTKRRRHVHTHDAEIPPVSDLAGRRIAAARRAARIRWLKQHGVPAHLVHKLADVRRCECGLRAHVVVIFSTLGANGQLHTDALLLCAAHAAEADAGMRVHALPTDDFESKESEE